MRAGRSSRPRRISASVDSEVRRLVRVLTAVVKVLLIFRTLAHTAHARKRHASLAHWTRRGPLAPKPSLCHRKRP